MAPHRTLAIWALLLSAAVLVVTWLIASPSWVKSHTAREYAMVEETFGEVRAQELYQRVLRATDATWKLAMSLIGRNGTSRWARERSEAGYWITQRITLRLAAALFWSLLLAPLIVAALIDGLVVRARARVQADYVNPVRFQLGFHLLHGALLIPLILIAYPWPLHPLWLAGWWLLVVAGIHLVASYLHHRL